MALVACGVSVLAMTITFTYLTGVITKISSQAISVVTKFGGLLIATIGAQLALSGIKSFFEM